MKRTLYLIAGICWLLFAGAFALFLVLYVVGGAGLQFFGLGISSVSVLLGMVHVTGFAAGSCLCLGVGLGLCERGLRKDKDSGQSERK